MKKLKRWLRDTFSVEEFNDLDTVAISEAFNDQTVRTLWLMTCFEELKRINLDVDRRLLSGSETGLLDLCARRKAYQDVLESIASARRTVTQDTRHNPPAQVAVNLDRVTA